MQSLSLWNRNHKYTYLDRYLIQVCVGDSRKTGSSLVEAFKKIFKQGRKPKKLPTDVGSQIKNKIFQTSLKNENVHHFVTYNESKAQVAERFNRTLKQLLWRMFNTTSSYQYLDKLDSLIDRNYNQIVKGLNPGVIS